jgi:YidC/Oxa1 family membrane protein insertase
MFPLTQQQMRSMRAMQEIQPKTKYIQEIYKDDPQLMQQKIMEMYKEHGVNPMGGCLPLLIQMPIFIAFYQSLILMSKTVFATAQNPGFLWIQNIGILVKDDPNLWVFPFLPLILPILSAATTYLQQRISMVDNNEPTQKAMLYFMPVMMAYITYTVPGGLGLYWVVFNLLGILQQLYVNRIHLNQKLDTGTGIEVDAPQRLLEEEKNEPVARRDKGGKEKNAGPNNRKKGKKR